MSATQARRARRSASSARGLRGALAIGVALFGACVSVGEGTGTVKSDHLYAEDCWDGPFDLEPNFFAADPHRNTMHIRAQRGSDLLEVTDALVVLVDDVEEVRTRLGEDLPVTIPQGVAPPGVGINELCAASACDSPVHVALYLLDSCHSQNIVLYGVGGTIRFDELFSGDPNEEDAADKLTEATFEIDVGDPQDVIFPEDGPPEIPNQSRIRGNFRFFFQRGQPAQPFP